MNAPTIELRDLHTQPALTQEAATEAAPPQGDEGGQQSQSGLFDTMLVPMAMCFLVFWFIVIRPEKRQRQAREAMLSALSKGDDVITSGGIHGKVAQVKDEIVTVQVADSVRMRFALSAVQAKLGDEEPEDDEKKSDED